MPLNPAREERLGTSHPGQPESSTGPASADDRPISHPPGSGRNIPWALAATVCLVCCIETGIKRHSYLFTTVAAENWRYSGEAARKQAKDAEILVQGSSVSKFGVVPQIIERETGKRTFNLAALSGPAGLSYFVLRRALDAGARPEAIILDCTDRFIPAWEKVERWPIIKDNLRVWPEMLSGRETLDLAWSARDPAFLAHVAVAKSLPSYRSRYEIRRRLTLALKETPDHLTGTVLASQRNWNVNRGVHASSKVLSEGPPPQVEPLHSAIRWRQNRPAISYFDRLIELARENRIRVFFVLMPLSQRIHAEQLARGVVDKQTQFASRAVSLLPELVVIDARFSQYPNEAFADTIHLNVKGASSLSSEIGRIVRSHLTNAGSPRGEWVQLPAYRPTPTPPELEDLDQSMLALQGRNLNPKR